MLRGPTPIKGLRQSFGTKPHYRAPRPPSALPGSSFLHMPSLQAPERMQALQQRKALVSKDDHRLRGHRRRRYRAL